MTTNDRDEPNAPNDLRDQANDLTYAEALAAAQPRIAELGAHLTALADQVLATWQEVEPAIRAWVARAAMLTEQQWMDEPESTRAFFETWRQWFAEHDSGPDSEQRSDSLSH